MKNNTINAILAILFATLLAAGGCGNEPPAPATQSSAASNLAARPLFNGAYLVLREAPTPQDANTNSPTQGVLVYDRRKYSDAPPDEPLAYVAIDLTDFVPLIIEGTPEMQKDGRGFSKLTVSLARQNADKLEAFTRSHLGGRIALVIDGQIITLHKIRSVVTGGKLQITRCTDNACQAIRAKLIQ